MRSTRKHPSHDLLTLGPYKLLFGASFIVSFWRDFHNVKSSQYFTVVCGIWTGQTHFVFSPVARINNNFRIHLNRHGREKYHTAVCKSDRLTKKPHRTYSVKERAIRTKPSFDPVTSNRISYLFFFFFFHIPNLTNSFIRLKCRFRAVDTRVHNTGARSAPLKYYFRGDGIVKLILKRFKIRNVKSRI